MCRIKTGEQITEMHDVQNLVTACILRSKQPYSISTLSNEIIDSCKGSKLTITDKQIKLLVRDTTTALLRSKYISANSGRYFAQPIFSHNK